MKKIAILLIFGACFIFVTSSAFAGPSAKFTAYTTDILFANAASGNADIELGIKTPNKADLLIGVSLQTGIYTQTRVKSQKGVVDLETASGTITVRVEVYKDGVDVSDKVFPNSVNFDHRAQTLEAKLGGIPLVCADTGTFAATWNSTTGQYDCVEDPIGVPDGIITAPCECTYDDEEINLILDTMGAHHFNFVAKDLEAGEYEIHIIVTGSTTATSSDASATVGVGPSSITVEQVKATNSPNGIEFDVNS